MGVLREAEERKGGYPVTIKEKNGEGPIPLSIEGPGFTPLPGPFFVPAMLPISTKATVLG
jgi:hypothetical protein